MKLECAGVTVLAAFGVVGPPLAITAVRHEQFCSSRLCKGIPGAWTDYFHAEARTGLG